MAACCNITLDRNSFLPIGDATASTTAQQVSGASLFWALAALALNAMTQQSFCGYVSLGESFEGTLSPHRSSPFICVLDAAAELPIIIQKWRKRGASIARVEPPTYTTATEMTLTIFTLGVLPQAIKVFSMRGIPGNQMLAAMLLFSSIDSMVRTLNSSVSDTELRDNVERLQTTFGGNDEPANLLKLSILLGRIPHSALLFCVWYCIAADAYTALPEHHLNLKNWISSSITLLLILYVPYYAWRYGAVKPAELQ
ncbi:hypothetical protein LTR85_005951 [Meristemomyces frigidus]|nr:hypothetical protein LTR85_005951 [Meristemomyces frigidus]